jgi:hypothetical protein
MPRNNASEIFLIECADGAGTGVDRQALACKGGLDQPGRSDIGFGTLDGFAQGISE